MRAFFVVVVFVIVEILIVKWFLVFIKSHRNVLLSSPKTTPTKPKRVLSGLSSRANRMNAASGGGGMGIPPVPSTSAELDKKHAQLN